MRKEWSGEMGWVQRALWPGCVFVLLAAMVAVTGCKDKVQLTGGVEHHLYIRASSGGAGHCSIVDENGSSDVKVQRGDSVVWHNETGSDVQLTFGGVMRLFGVLVAKAYADGDPLTLKVRSDAEETEHGYRSSCGPNQTGSKIIVCPPAGC